MDSEKVEAMLVEAGYLRAETPEQADVVMINTCAFIEEARRESIAVILEATEVKRADAKTVVIGCLAQRFGPEVVAALPEVDGVLGLDRYGELVSTLDRLTGWTPETAAAGVPVQLRRRPAMDILEAVNRPAPTMPYAYVKVAEGCDKPCTFCAIPLIRGKQRSRSPENLRREIAGLAAAGVSEVVLVAQDLAAYGRDTAEPGGLVALLASVAEMDGIHRIRLLYLYPKEIRPDLIALMASHPRIAPYFDLSLQHAAGELLRAMKRPGNGERHLGLIGDIRAADSTAALRSSFIVGFPGETEAQVEMLADFLVEARLDWAGFFPYSAEEGTPAAELSGRVARTEVEDRLRYLQGVQEEISQSAQSAVVGEMLEVLVDQVEDGVPVGRSYREAPEIDGVILLDGGRPGEWVRAEITGTVGTDLEARIA